MSQSHHSPRYAPDSLAALAHTLVLILVAAIVMVAFFAFITPSVLGGMDGLLEAGPRALLVVSALGVFEFVVVVLLGLVLWGRRSLSDLGWRVEGLGRALAFGLLGALALFGLLLATVASFAPDQLGDTLDTVRSFTLQQRLLFAFIGLSAAATEESLFRGQLQPLLIKRWGHWPGIVVGAAIFSVYHLPRQPLQLVSRFLFGMVLGGLRERTGTLIAPAIAHTLFWILAGLA